MLLVVDVGNTQTHLGTFEGTELIEHWRFATVRKSTADELGAALRNLLALRGMSFADLDAAIVSSTVPRLRPEWDEVGERYRGHELLVGGPGRRTGMAIRYARPREVGPHRLASAPGRAGRRGHPRAVVALRAAGPQAGRCATPRRARSPRTASCARWRAASGSATPA